MFKAAKRRRPARERDVDGVMRRGGGLIRLVRGPALFDRLLQLVGEAPDVLLLIGRCGGNQRHPRGDDAVLAAEVVVADGLRVTGRARRTQIGLEGGNLGPDRVRGWKTHHYRLLTRDS